MLPERVRVNMRYRGPRESAKMARIQAEAVLNIERMKEQLTELTKRLSQHKCDIYKGKSLNAIEEPIQNRMQNLDRRTDYLERGAYGE